MDPDLKSRWLELDSGHGEMIDFSNVFVVGNSGRW